jgi:DNA-binding transcriptional MerR regulator
MGQVYTHGMSAQKNTRQRDGYLSVGRFAQAVQLSRKALRLYDQLGILVPDYVDPESGYRYYSTAQFEKARFIRLLRGMEMPLADVRLVLAAKTTDKASQLVIDCRRAFETKAEQVRRASHKVLAYLRKENDTMSINVSVKTFPVCQAVSIKKNITVPAFHQFIPNALNQLSTYVKEEGATINGDPICFYHGPVNESDDGPVEICFPVDGSVVPRGDIVVREIPVHRGAIGTATSAQINYPVILDVWDAVVSWVHKNKFEMTDETVCCYEIWHKDDTISIVQPFESQD